MNNLYDKVRKGGIVISGVDDIVWYKDKNDMIIEMLGKALGYVERLKYEIRKYKSV